MKYALPKIAFVHIPRTGGMSLRMILETIYGYAKMFNFYGDEISSVANGKIAHFASLDSRTKNSFAALSGHFVYDFDKSLKDFHYITLLRDPIKRAISYYFHILTDKNNYLHRILVQRRIKLEQFLTSEFSLEFDNYQVRAISGTAFNSAYMRINENHLELAKENLQKNFSMFGLTESFESSIQAFSERFNWSLPIAVRINTGNYRDGVELSTECLEIASERNRFDIELYGFARSLLTKRIGNIQMD